MSYPPIANHGIIGNQRTAALVGLDGTIDFMCVPRFGSPSVFVALLDAEKGGRFELRPKNFKGAKQLYLPETNVLMTRFLADAGAVEVTDAMPMGHDDALLVRDVHCVRGSVEMRLFCAPRFDYARGTHRVEKDARGLRFVPSSGPTLCLSGSQPLEVEANDGVASFTLRAGERAWFLLEQGESKHPGCNQDWVREVLRETCEYWRNWIVQCTYDGRWRDVVRRSALTLKLLTSEEHGTVAAAATFGLPEIVGGSSNWDYRYAWIRDASFTISALMQLGLHRETTQFVSWLMRRHADPERDEFQTLYNMDGGSDVPEVSLAHLQGYEGSRPVRIGNDAARQRQLDIYGEFMSAVDEHDLRGYPVHTHVWQRIATSLNWLCENWPQPDHGIWEIRGARREYLYSRLLAWVALNSGLRISHRRGLPAPVEHWRRQRDAIYADIHSRFWSDQEQSFVQAAGESSLDASVLTMPLFGFISPMDPRWLSTLAAVERHLVTGPLVRRYAPCSTSKEQRQQATEGTFNICTFWYVEALARSGRQHEARLVFEKVLSYSNHLGLYSEELSVTGEQLGNFPQALTHLGLIRAACVLNQELNDAAEA